MVVRRKQKSPQVIGKEFEGWVQELLVELQTTKPLAFSRVYDTMSAGAFLPAQPCDFEVGYEGVTTKLELKTSTIFSTLTRTYIGQNISDQQGALFRLWGRSGVGVFYLFKDVEGGFIELWDGLHVVEVKTTPKMQLNMDKRLCRVKATKENAKEVLMNLFTNQAKRIRK